MIPLELIHVSKTYANRLAPAVCNISLCVQQGECLALLAPSGSGKTTLLRLIAGFETLDSGSILLHERDASRLPPERRGIGMVAQGNSLFPHLTVSQNIGFGLHPFEAGQRREKLEHAIDLLGLTSLRNRYPHELSGGQQQRVALARVLAPNPIMILLDEPFNSLDPPLRAEIRAEVASLLRRLGSTVILVTHDHEEAFAMADRIAVLNAGRLEQHDTPDRVYHLPATPFVARFVGQADFLPGQIEQGTVLTEIGQFPTKIATQTEPAMMMIRPDDIDLLLQTDGIATVVERQFKGSENLYTIALPSGQRLHSSQHSLSVYPLGARVALKLNVTHTVLFPQQAFSSATR